MFKVICTNHDEYPGTQGWPWGDMDPKIGQECEVLAECMGQDIHGKFVPSYRLRGFSGFLYGRQNFSTLNGPCEIELHAQHVEKLTAEFEAKYGEPPIVKMDPVAFAKIWEGITRELNKTGWK